MNRFMKSIFILILGLVLAGPSFSQELTENCTGMNEGESESGKTRFCHMLNGTAIAASRAPIALIENHQQADGSIRIPKALMPYTGFDRIG